jgi:hypothetical protein
MIVCGGDSTLKGELMALRHVLFGVAAAALFLSTSGCMPGPINDRLHVSEWKAKKDNPIQVERNWEYPGEAGWEETVTVDQKTFNKDWTGTVISNRADEK